jgi:hypothetical protein
MTRRRAVVLEAGLTRGRVDRHADGVDWPMVGDRLAVLKQRRQREDRHARHVDEQRVEFLRRFLRPHRRPQGGDLFDRQMRVGAGWRVMDDKAHLGQMRHAPEMIIRRYAIGCRRLDDRAGVIEQGRRNRNLEGVGQIGLVVACFIDQSQVISASAAGTLRVVDRPEVDMAAIGQTDFSEHAVDRCAFDAAQGMGDRVQQW